MNPGEPMNRDERQAAGAQPGVMKRSWSIVLGMAIFALFVILGGQENLARLGDVRAVPVAGATLATMGITGLIAFRWGTVANALMGTRITGLLNYYYYFMVGRFLGFFLPKDVTDIASRTLMLSRYHKIPMSRSATSVVFDRFGDVLAMVVLLPACLPYWFGWVSGIEGVGILLTVALVTAVLLYTFHDRATTVVGKSLDLMAAVFRYVPGMRRHVDTLGSFPGFEKGTLLIFYLASVLKVFLTAVRFALFALAMGIPIPFTLIIMGTPLGQLSYMFSFTPGGLGILEAGWFGILVFSGFTKEYASAFVVGQRVLTVAIIAILTLITHIGYSWYKRADGSPGEGARGNAAG